MKTIMNFILKIFELLKGDPQTKIAKYLISSALILLVGIGTLKFTYNEYSVEYSDDINIMGYLLLIIGLIMLIHRYLTMKNNPITLVYGQGIINMNIYNPIEAVPKYERFDCISLDIKEIDSYDKKEVIEDYKFNKRLLENRIQNKNSKKVYVGALGSFPYLFLLGALFRNAYSEVITLDFDRHKSKWYKLPLFNEKEKSITHILLHKEKSIYEKILELNNSNKNEVGIALSYTFEINKNAIPISIKNHTLFLKHSNGIGHDKLSNEESQKELLKELSFYIATLWNTHNKIHLFVSAQASMCINIGKIYMNNAHGTLILHNYDNNSKSYNWSIEFNQGDLL